MGTAVKSDTAPLGTSRLRSRLLLSLLFSVLVFAGLAFYGDLPQVGQALAGFPWLLLLPILLLTFLNYLLRALKFHYFLACIGVRNVTFWQSCLLFFAGLSMVITPGKVGEWVKSYLLRELAGVAIARSAPIIIAERLTDGIAMLLLALGGLLAFQVAWPVALGSVALFGAILALVRARPVAEAALAVAARLPLLARRVGALRAMYESTQDLFSWRSLGLAVPLGFVSWGGECLALYLVYLGLGQEPSAELLLQAAFILAISTLAGALLLLPGGLGAAEGGITGLSQLLVGLGRDGAVAATLLIRLGTLWFGVAVGAAALLLLLRRLRRSTAM